MTVGSISGTWASRFGRFEIERHAAVPFERNRGMASAAVPGVAIVGVIVKMNLAAMVAGRATVDVQDLVGHEASIRSCHKLCSLLLFRRGLVEGRAPCSFGDSFSAKHTLGHGMSIVRRVCRVG